MSDDRYLNEQALDPSPDSAWGKLLGLVPRGARVLDVGCGHGAFAATLRRSRGCHVTGVERNAEYAADARSRCDALLVGDAAELLARGEVGRGYDVVIAADVLEHLVDPGSVLERLRDVLAPGGVLLASLPNVTHLSVVAALAAGRFPRAREGLLDDTHLQFYGHADALELFARAGYAARLADRVVLDPRHTEFRTDLAAVPAPVLEYLDRNPHATTYQFIVRAVPEAWARAEDRVAPAAPAPAKAAVQASLAAELAAAERTIAAYHDAALRREAELAALNATAGRQHEALVVRNAVLASRAGRPAGRARAIARASRAGAERLRVLYVADRDDAPFRYRCLHGAAQLRDAGALANVARLDAPDLLERIPAYTMVVLFRLPWSERVRQVVERAREGGAAVAFDVDDYVFDPRVEAMMPFLPRLGAAEVERYRETFAGLARTLDAADFCVVTTDTLAECAGARGKPALVHPNLLAPDHVRLSRVVARLRGRLMRRPYVAYLSGSNTHDGDLASVADGVAAALRRVPELSLLLAGHVEPPPALAELSERILRVPYLDHRLYPWVMARCRAVLAPIEVLNDFTNSKSALKVFEAGAFGVPAVVSPTLPYARAVEDGVSGYVASGAEQWTAAIEALSDAATSRRMGRVARELALAEHSPEAWRGVLAHELLARNGRSGLPAPALAPLARTRPRERWRLVRRSLTLALKLPAAVATSAPPDPAALVRAIAVTPRRGRELVRGEEAIGLVLVDRERTLLEVEAGPGTTVLAGGRGAGNTVACDHDDPMLRIPPLAVPPGASTLVVEARARSGRSAVNLKLYWSPKPSRGFVEERSAWIQLEANDRWSVGATTLPASFHPGRRYAFRLDPADAPGEVELGVVALVSADGLGRVGPEEVRPGLARRFAPAPGGAAPRLDGAAGLAALANAASDSQDLVACDETLEHATDPLGALRERLRVVRPGGHLSASLRERPDAADPRSPVLDRARFERVLRLACADAGAALVELQRVARGDLVEHVAVLRRREPPARAQPPRAGPPARSADPAILYLLHASPWAERPGGTEFHVRDLLRALRLPRAVVAWPEGSAIRAGAVLAGDVERPEASAFPFAGADEAGRSISAQVALRALVEKLGVRAAHVHHLLGWPRGVLRALEDADVPFVFTHHDYYAVCPNWNLYDYARGEPCACPPGGAGCLASFSRATGFLAGADLDAERARHREAMDRSLAAARAHVFPSAAARAVFERHLGAEGPPRLVIEHGYDGAVAAARPPPGPALRVALVGEIAYAIKGADRYLELLATARELPVEWHVFGDARPFGFEERLRAVGVGDRLILHGRYARHALPDLLRREGIDLCVLLPNWDETFSYVVSEALLAGVPLVASARGALRQRVAESGAGIAVETVAEAASALARLCADRAPLVEWTARASAHRHRPVAARAASHRALYARLGWIPGAPIAAAAAPAAAGRR